MKCLFAISEIIPIILKKKCILHAKSLQLGLVETMELSE